MARLDYLNAWVGARRTRLLGASGLRALLACASTEARCELLRHELPRAPFPVEPVPDPLARVEAALREDWRGEAAAVLEAAEGRRPRALLATFLALDEAVAVKVILRGVSQALPPDRTVAAAPPTPGLPDAALRAAAAAGSVEDAVVSLAAAGCALAGPVRDALPLREGGGLLPLELAADRAAFARARRACRGRSEDAALLRAHLGDRADVRNAATLLVLAGAAPVEDPFVAPGRRLPADVFRALLGAPAAAVRAAVARLFGLPERDLALPWSADRALERAVGASLRREARSRPLSLAVPLSYLAERLAEVRRIAVVMRGAALGLEGAEILDLAEA